MKVVELPAAPEVLARVDLSHNGAGHAVRQGRPIRAALPGTAGGRLPVQWVPLARVPGAQGQDAVGPLDNAGRPGRMTHQSTERGRTARRTTRPGQHRVKRWKTGTPRARPGVDPAPRRPDRPRFTGAPGSPQIPSKTTPALHPALKRRGVPSPLPGRPPGTPARTRPRPAACGRPQAIVRITVFQNGASTSYTIPQAQPHKRLYIPHCLGAPGSKPTTRREPRSPSGLDKNRSGPEGRRTCARLPRGSGSGPAVSRHGGTTQVALDMGPGQEPGKSA